MEVQDLSLFHLIRKPKVASQKAPLLLMLHGYGSNEQDLFSFSEELPENLFVISVRAPFPMDGMGNAWYDLYLDANSEKFSNDEQAIASRDKIVHFIDEATENYPVDPKNVTLLGFSQGTILSLAIALSYPEKVQHVIGLSGYVHPEIYKSGFEKNDFSNLSMYISHGNVDQVIPVEWARKTKPFLDSLGVKNSYSEFTVGHGVAPQNFFELKNWLQKNL